MVDYYLGFVDNSEKRVLVINISPYSGEDVDEFVLDEWGDLFDDLVDLVEEPVDVESESVCSLSVGSVVNLVRIRRILEEFGDLFGVVKVLGLVWSLRWSDDIKVVFLSEGSVSDFEDKYVKLGYIVWEW